MLMVALGSQQLSLSSLSLSGPAAHTQRLCARNAPVITGGMSCAAESRSSAPVILFQEITSSMASVTVVATTRSQSVRKCWRDKMRFLVILCRHFS